MERCIAPGGCRVARLESCFLAGRAALGLEAAGGLFAPIPMRRSGREIPDFGPKIPEIKSRGTPFLAGDDNMMFPTGSAYGIWQACWAKGPK
jgi:hypothetical protein